MSSQFRRASNSSPSINIKIKGSQSILKQVETKVNWKCTCTKITHYPKYRQHKRIKVNLKARIKRKEKRNWQIIPMFMSRTRLERACSIYQTLIQIGKMLSNILLIRPISFWLIIQDLLWLKNVITLLVYRLHFLIHSFLTILINVDRLRNTRSTLIIWKIRVYKMSFIEENLCSRHRIHIWWKKRGTTLD